MEVPVSYVHDSKLLTGGDQFLIWDHPLISLFIVP